MKTDAKLTSWRPILNLTCKDNHNFNHLARVLKIKDNLFDTTKVRFKRIPLVKWPYLLPLVNRIFSSEYLQESHSYPPSIRKRVWWRIPPPISVWAVINTVHIQTDSHSSDNWYTIHLSICSNCCCISLYISSCWWVHPLLSALFCLYSCCLCVCVCVCVCLCVCSPIIILLMLWGRQE